MIAPLSKTTRRKQGGSSRRLASSLRASLRNGKARSQCGFTLIEVILSIGLATVLIAILASALNLFLIRVSESGDGIRQGQLARSIMRLIADDLRSAATSYEQDTSAAESLAATQAQYDVDELDELGQDDTSTEETSTRRIMGVYGDAVSIAVDVNRSRSTDPLVEFGSNEIQAPLAVESPAASLGGITTVRYFVTAEGLARQETRRDIDTYELDQGGSPSLEASTRIIAPEVVDLQLVYSDGEQTLAAWDSEELEGALPVVVEFTVTFRKASNTTNSDSTTTAEQYYTQRMAVALPTVIAVETSSETEDESEASSAGAAGL